MSLAPASELVLRSRDKFAGRRVLLAGAPADELARQLPAAAVAIWSWDYGHHLALLQQGIASHFGAEPPAGHFDTLLVFMPKAKPRLGMVLALAADRLTPGARVYLVGEKREGIDSAARLLDITGGQPAKVDRARHCVLWETEWRNAVTPARLASFMVTREREIAGQALRLCSLPGVFSHEKPDDGTLLLLQQLSLLPRGAVLDFGCGCGVIAAFVLLRQPTQLTLHAVDSDAFALAATEATLAANGLSARVYPSEGLSAVTERRFAAVVSNPPFHEGVRTDHRMTAGFLRDIASHLMKGGELWLVANRFLPYAESLADTFAGMERRTETARFVVYHATR